VGTRLLLKLLARVAAPALLVAVLLVVLVRLDILDAPLRNLAEDIGILSRETRSSSEVLLEELGEIYRLNTVEYIYRTVFPFDYMPETTDLTDIMATIRESRGSLDEVLSADQRLYFDAFNLADEVGLGEEEFLVLTVRVFAGFDLAGTPFEGAGARGAAYVTVEPDGSGEGRRATVRIPPAEVTDIVIEDVDPATYPYPDVGLDADGWRRVAAFIAEHVEARTVDEGILETATDNARELVTTLLLSAGIDQVSFVQPSSANDAKSPANSESRR
jgi:hypothetical protein